MQARLLETRQQQQQQQQQENNSKTTLNYKKREGLERINTCAEKLSSKQIIIVQNDLYRSCFLFCLTQSQDRTISVWVDGRFFFQISLPVKFLDPKIACHRRHHFTLSSRGMSGMLIRFPEGRKSTY